MPGIQHAIAKHSVAWHKKAALLSALSLFIFAGSGALHPLMTWTGPKAAAFFPPQCVASKESIGAVPRILARYLIKHAVTVKIVPSQHGPVLQVIEHTNAPGRYFNLETEEELTSADGGTYDATQARWLARYYTGRRHAPIENVTFQTTFDAAYPAVNRLLPVYRITFAGQDKLTAYIYTELSALAGLTDARKTTIQGLFRILHTWSPLDQAEGVRVALVTIMPAALLLLSATGMAMLFFIKKKRNEPPRRLHRWIAYGVHLPLLGFSVSGLYHLWFHAYDARRTQAPMLRSANMLDLSPSRFSHVVQTPPGYQEARVNAVSVVEGPNGHLLYRFTTPQGQSGKEMERSMRYRGVPIEKAARYLQADSGRVSEITDKDMAVRDARLYMEHDQGEIVHISRVTRFGPDYDFRNKRLPVWRVDYRLPNRKIATLFVDPATGMQVDKQKASDRYERFSFSFLHKWNMLKPLVGRGVRDALMVATLFCAMVGAATGLILRFKPKKKKTRA